MYSIKLISLFFIFILILSGFKLNTSNEDEINRDNYYDYLTNENVRTDWISHEECVTIITEALKSLGYKIKSGILFKINEETVISVDGFEPYKKFGYVVQKGHAFNIQKSDRTENKPFKYMIYNKSGVPSITYTSDIPDNIFIFKEDWYWYQETMNSNVENIVTKDIAIKILKEDLQYYLKQFNSKKS